MSKLKSLEEFKAFQQEAAEKLAKQTNKVLVCSGTGCMAAGAKAVYDKFVEVLSKSDVPFSVSWEDEKDGAFNLKKCGCMGCCALGPLVRIDPLDVYYVHVTAADVEEIVNKTIKNGEVVARLVEYEDGVQYPHLTKDYPFYKKQSRYLPNEATIIIRNNCLSDIFPFSENIRYSLINYFLRTLIATSSWY